MKQIEIYQARDKQTRIGVKFEGDIVWLSQKQLAAVFGRERTVITGHINNIIKEAELKKKSVCASVAHTPGCFSGCVAAPVNSAGVRKATRL